MGDYVNGLHVGALREIDKKSLKTRRGQIGIADIVVIGERRDRAFRRPTVQNWDGAQPEIVIELRGSSRSLQKLRRKPMHEYQSLPALFRPEFLLQLTKKSAIRCRDYRSAHNGNVFFRIRTEFQTPDR